MKFSRKKMNMIRQVLMISYKRWRNKDKKESINIKKSKSMVKE